MNDVHDVFPFAYWIEQAHTTSDGFAFWKMGGHVAESKTGAGAPECS
jgi:hypothetical protein